MRRAGVKSAYYTGAATRAREARRGRLKDEGGRMKDDPRASRDGKA
jgi:hypothetical protein